jgi:MFS family permease
MPTEVRGRIFGVLASIVSAASLVPTLVAGPLADRVSPSLVIGIVGLAVFGLGLWSAVLFGPRAPRRHDAD